MRAAATLDATGGGVRWRDAPPVVLRPTGRDRVHLVHAAGGPLGGDELSLRARVAAGCALTVSSVAATVVQPGVGAAPASWRVDLTVGAGACLRWTPQATVVTDAATFHSAVHAELAEDAFLLVREQVLLGRSGQAGGRYRGGLAVTVGGRPLLRHETVLDGRDPDLSGPAGSGGYRVLGTLLVAGPGVTEEQRGGVEADLRWAVLPLAGPGYLVLVLGRTATAVGAVLDGHERLAGGGQRPKSAFPPITGGFPQATPSPAGRPVA
ncbi:MAG TPA: urease accessory protein UreD [Pseudonocardiaceae bacterium]|jgi:urease accessory protein|nr:urease accessory protein UreD [Pseudonocardiaceae bacterium]